MTKTIVMIDAEKRQYDPDLSDITFFDTDGFVMDIAGISKPNTEIFKGKFQVRQNP